MYRFFALFLITIIFSSCSHQKENYPPFQELTQSLRNEKLKPFYHGVASGDPLRDRVIIWTRVTPADSVPSIDVVWEMATDSLFENIVQNGKIKTSPEKDYTVKVDVKKLKADTDYFYRFKALDGISLTGRTKTAYQDASQLKFGVVSCSNYEWGYFTAYANLAQEEDLQAVLHLGDYIYEYGPATYGDTTLGRINIPNHEIISLKDYRDRYSQYRLDEDLQAVHAKHPFINIWDDHEIANNSYVDGAQNHQPDEGDYAKRRDDAIQAFYEWLPIRAGKNHYRDFEFGDLATVFMLDERLTGRTAPADSLTDPVLNEESHRLLGEVQFDWLTNNLITSKAQWKVIGNQVIYSYLDWGYEGFHVNLDSWDGYPREQQMLADVMQQETISNVMFLTGDTHTSWAFEATNNPFEQYNPETGEGAFAIEFGVTSINAANDNERNPDDKVREHEQKIVGATINPHLKYVNMRDHGYLIITLTDSLARAQFKTVNTVREKSSGVTVDKTFTVQSNSHALKSQ